MLKKPKFFKSPAAFRDWLQAHHGAGQELLVGFYKTGSGRAGITWRQSVDEALCFGWIDGVRKRLDDASYTIRFTPRKKNSVWSAINIKRAQALAAEGRMAPAGLKAFQARRANKSGVYSYEQRPQELIEPYGAMLASNPAASRFFHDQTPSYRRALIWWVVSAKREETRRTRAERLIEISAKKRLHPQFLRKAPST